MKWTLFVRVKREGMVKVFPHPVKPYKIKPVCAACFKHLTHNTGSLIRIEDRTFSYCHYHMQFVLQSLARPT